MVPKLLKNKRFLGKFLRPWDWGGVGADPRILRVNCHCNENYRVTHSTEAGCVRRLRYALFVKHACNSISPSTA
eukprot:5775596-Amphidinium_carterae.2